ncbi:MAG: MFS transporter [Candidatus Krumholzibacteria bacterium]|nr:MFS transporter [Candidatus Krumholzibacteria bacterium]
MVEAARRKLNESAGMRWFALILISTLLFSTYWFQDCLGPLKGLMESELGLNSDQFGRIASSTTWANLALMIIVGGIALDKWGIRKTGTLFGILAVAGAAIVALAAKGVFGSDERSTMIWMIVGRILFGTGLETVCVMVSRTVVKWFKGYELALAMGINVGFGRLGSAGTNFFGIEIANNSVFTGVSFAATLIGLSLICFLVYLILDVKFDKAAGIQAGEGDGDKFKFKDLTDLITNHSFIFIALLCVAFYSAVFPFVQYAPDLLINKFGFTSTLPDMTGWSFAAKFKAFFHNGPKVTSLIPLGTILFTPIFGRLVDKKGKAATLMIIGSLLLIFAHLSLSVFNNVILGYFGLFALGIAFSLVPAAMWPSVAKIVPENRLGTAYATMFTIQNYGLAAFFWGIGKVLNMVNPAVVNQIRETRESLIASGMSMNEVPVRIEELKLAGEIPPYNYTMPILMLVVLGIISIFLAFQLKRADKRQGYGLEMPTGHEG